jgi:hypothetical protein
VVSTIESSTIESSTIESSVTSGWVAGAGSSLSSPHAVSTIAPARSTPAIVRLGLFIHVAFLQGR